MPELVGVMGSSGFFGWILGPILGDLLFSGAHPTRPLVDRMFLLAAAAAGVAIVFAMLATHGTARPTPKRRPPMWALLRRYHPGPVLLVAAAMGAGVGLPHTFLRPYTMELNIPNLKTFFTAYAVTAFSVRIATRRFTERFGIRAMNLMGLVSMAAAMLLFLTIRSEWMLVIPALVFGVSHALLFPAVVGGGSGFFPKRYRGMGTVLVLAMFDAGNLFGQPIIGSIIEAAKWQGLPAYPTMFACVAAGMLATAGGYALLSRPSVVERNSFRC